MVVVVVVERTLDRHTKKSFTSNYTQRKNEQLLKALASENKSYKKRYSEK